jgi:hypothetical protein
MGQKRAAPALPARGGKTSMCFESPRSSCMSLTLDPSGDLIIAPAVDDTTSEQEVPVLPPSPRLFPPGHTRVDAKGLGRCREVATPAKDAVAACFPRTGQGSQGAERKRSIP